MSKKFKLDKVDELIVDAAIKKVRKGPKERPRPRSSRQGRTQLGTISQRTLDGFEERVRSLQSDPVAARQPVQAFDPGVYATRAVVRLPDPEPVHDFAPFEPVFTFNPTELIYVPEVDNYPIGTIGGVLSVPDPSMRTVRMTREERDAEIRIERRLVEWFPNHDPRPMERLATILRRQHNVWDISTPGLNWSTWVEQNQSTPEWYRTSICFRMRTGDPGNAYGALLSDVLNWYLGVSANMNFTIDWSGFHQHPCIF